ncbi:uncharacterized protein LY89DRAFT_688211 [Mollisia scopiformis]|uniref:F-box domain-containing protein n=1 Tax=Mollisia scopiformis TaxID=149040 RepID=A0A194WX40_MOLSC|nr:uncharacterized protein LY89DRAFT_688211 [Mollisia scopiformis]KUJ12543.1 hypothetical protein LY89DRAFT_688211 [Mollisia scopiformis]
MANLSTLPDEILLQILTYLTPAPLTLSSKPHAYWPAYLSKHRESTLPQTKDIASLAHTSSHLYSILYASLHSTLHLSNASSPAKLWDSITLNGRLGLSITSAHISSISPENCVFIFFLPNIRSIYLSGWSDWETFDPEDDSLNGDSPITHLYLSNCGAFEAPLKQVLSWPRELKELWFEASQGEWEGHLEGEEAVGFTCSAISRALEPLAASLEKLVFTRVDPGHEGLFITDGIDLRKFEKLRELKTFEMLLVGYDSQHGMWKNLPSGLESLEVWYDDPGYSEFLTGGLPEWLLGILRRKKERFPKLGRVRGCVARVVG